MQSSYIRFRYIAAIAVLLTSIACKKELPLKSPDFDATVAKNSYSVNDTIAFQFSGQPDFITFYAGLPGSRYEYRDRTTQAGTPVLQFTSARANGSQPNSLQVMVSADFAGVAADTAITLANIGKASWTDITGKAVLSAGAAANSGPIDLSDFANAGKPVYLAFRYTAVAGSVQNKWTITNLTVNNNLKDGTTYLIGNLNAFNTAIINYGNSSFSPGWVSYKIANTYAWTISAGTSLVITGATNKDLAAPAEAWVFMGPLNLQKVTPDAGVPIKNVGENMSKFPYNYQYTTPGTYKATFVGANINKDQQKSVVKTLDITIR
ncbi:DUF5017 domain-containing protein [Chitinophaga qingshengii]|uniref:DUF5017 domain-containing protein n=1 Tax=Chitinophaga qingshengii TaxID=1569794 RepID=A0ABR7TH75_9BACT|nr:DUF5017 domain-containing protein [Chitinophaga qingshengii]MBC9929842.1 DUF5017 domain-containing protein [Chitinophaga qingshengii]